MLEDEQVGKIRLNRKAVTQEKEFMTFGRRKKQLRRAARMS